MRHLVNIKRGILNSIGIAFGIMLLIMVINVMVYYPIVGAIGIYICVGSVVGYILLANKIGRMIEKEKEDVKKS